ncbi:hypothetical protein BD310DRAFT_926936 [Dichomitus squalens]|uniref:Uncharacterized protein n=1 Tax=Dichomitus squalens TaxID=114155 RepID=A0A4Q9PVS4_9APHY|nr:hypothetical protein BD310DRAFT_926936 [Dichomitus squalens]
MGASRSSPVDPGCRFQRWLHRTATEPRTAGDANTNSASSFPRPISPLHLEHPEPPSSRTRQEPGRPVRYSTVGLGFERRRVATARVPLPPPRTCCLPDPARPSLRVAPSSAKPCSPFAFLSSGEGAGSSGRSATQGAKAIALDSQARGARLHGQIRRRGFELCAEISLSRDECPDVRPAMSMSATSSATWASCISNLLHLFPLPGDRRRAGSLRGSSRYGRTISNITRFNLRAVGSVNLSAVRSSC